MCVCGHSRVVTFLRIFCALSNDEMSPQKCMNVYRSK